MGRTSTIVLVVGLALAFGLIVGVAGQYVRIPTFLWIILFPTFYAYWASLFRGRRSPAGESAHAGTETVLLEASDTGRRWIQTIVPLFGTVLGAAGVSMWVRADGGVSVFAVSATLIGIGLIVMSLRTIITWDVSYKGHAIRFQNDPCLAERLFIDGQLVARGGVGVHMVLSAPLTSGAAAGDIIKVTSRAGIVSLSCRIVAVTAASARV
jgi:hypothetical protein